MFYLGPAIPMYVFLVLSIIVFSYEHVMDILRERYEFFRDNFTFLELDEIEEGFDQYFESIDRKEIGWTFLEEEINRNKFNYATMPKEVLNEYK